MPWRIYEQLRRQEFLSVLPDAAPQACRELFELAGVHARALRLGMRSPVYRHWDVLDVAAYFNRWPFFATDCTPSEARLARALMPTVAAVEAWQARWKLPAWVAAAAWRQLRRGVPDGTAASVVTFEPRAVGPLRLPLRAPEWEPSAMSEAEYDEQVRAYKCAVVQRGSDNGSTIHEYQPLGVRMRQAIQFDCLGMPPARVASDHEDADTVLKAMRAIREIDREALQLPSRTGLRGPKRTAKTPPFSTPDLEFL